MIKINSYLGFVEISQEYFSNLISKIVSECFGVKGMVNITAAQKIKNLISHSDVPDKGVCVKIGDNDKLIVDVHIEISYGVNASAIVKSIISKVRYTIEEITGLSVEKVNVYVDNIKV